MRLIDAYWTPTVNHLWIACDCGTLLNHPSKVSLCKCPRCGRAELWHGVDPKPKTGVWSEPEMRGATQPAAWPDGSTDPIAGVPVHPT